MLAYLTGKVMAMKDSSVIIKIPSGQGFLVNINPGKRLMQNDNVEFFLFQVKREDKDELYGFDDLEEVNWLEKLLKVSGVGPKSAASIVYTLGITQIQEAINSSDAKVLSQVKGLGAKTAKKILVELKSSADVQKIEKNSEVNSSFSLDFVDTLSGLGYKRGEIVGIISRLKHKNLWNENDLVETVRSGLRELGRGK